MTVLVPSYREEVADRPQDAALGRAAGVPVPARRAAARRPAQPDAPADTPTRWPRPARWPPRSPRGCPSRAARFAARARAVRDAVADRRPGDRGRDARAGRRVRLGARLARTAADEEVIDDHVDAFFADQVLRALADDFAPVGDALLAGADEGAPCRASGWCSCTGAWPGRSAPRSPGSSASCTRRCRTRPNKAMNLNSYIGLMGRSYRAADDAGGPVLVAGRRAAGSIVDPGRRLRAHPRRRQRAAAASTACGWST